MLARSTVDPATIAVREGRFEESPTVSDAAVLGHYYAAVDELPEAAGYFEQAIEMAGTGDTFEFDLFLVKSWGIHDQLFTEDELKAAADEALASPAITIDQIVSVGTSIATLVDDAAAALPYVEAALAAAEGTEDENLLEARGELEIAYALGTGDTELAVRLKRETMPEGWDEDSRDLNSFAWWCFEHEVNLEEAEQLARKGAELAEDDVMKAMILDTAAEIVNLRGDRAGAITLMKEALALDPDNEWYRKQLDRFEGRLTESM